MSSTMRARAAATPLLDIIVESPLWEREPSAQAAVEAAIAAAADEAGPHDRPVEIAVVLTGDAAIRVLNSQWRDQDKPTNVLSFPAKSPPPPAGAALHLGDIVIAYETAAREAAEDDKPFVHHVSHLAVHGFLHLIGYDHQDETEAEMMERLERSILARLNVPDPYAGRDAGAEVDHYA